ncbi:hypothetical protein ZWY2020_020571 [Hordeum vulgare]|nr:hypothetical protein ZWY2020_020571 [Hordeum vulgare]
MDLAPAGAPRLPVLARPSPARNEGDAAVPTLCHSSSPRSPHTSSAATTTAPTPRPPYLDLESSGVWTDQHMDVYKDMEVVGVCNGVLCLCDDTKPGGAITLINPATGDMLALPSIDSAPRPVQAS